MREKRTRRLILFACEIQKQLGNWQSKTFLESTACLVSLANTSYELVKYVVFNVDVEHYLPVLLMLEDNYLSQIYK